jgi:hypothetical protein
MEIDEKIKGRFHNHVAAWYAYSQVCNGFVVFEKKALNTTGKRKKNHLPPYYNWYSIIFIQESFFHTKDEFELSWLVLPSFIDGCRSINQTREWYS